MVIKALMVTKAIRVVLVFVDDLVHQVRMQLHVIVQKLLDQKGMMVYLVKTVRKVLLVCLVYLVRTEHVVLKGHLVIKVFLVNLEELVVLVLKVVKGAWVLRLIVHSSIRTAEAVAKKVSEESLVLMALVVMMAY